MNNKTRNILISIVVILAIILLLIYGISYAKYVANSAWDYILKSRGFYLESNQLDINNQENVDNYWDGSNISFNIKNNLNDSIATDTDINYDVECSTDNENIKCNIYDTNKDSYSGIITSREACINDNGKELNINKTECQTNKYSWKTVPVQKNLYFNLTSTNDETIKDVNVKIKLTSTSPYKKVLEGTFELHKKDSNNSINIKYSNFTNHDRMVITNLSSDNKCISMKWDSNKAIIDTDYKMFKSYNISSDGYINEILFSINSKEAINYIFYNKQSTGKISKADFLIEEVNDC